MNDNEKKYELTDEAITVGDHTLYRIRALKDFGDVKTGDLGGFVESEENLSHEGNCWVTDKARVYGYAIVSDDAQICGNAQVFGRAVVCDDAEIYDNALVYDHVKLCGHAEVYGNAKIGGNCVVISGDAIIYW